MGRDWSWSRSFRRGEREEKVAPPAGCMSGVLQLFDLHQFLFRTTATTTTAHSRTEGDSLPQNHKVASPRGVVAPRNSLELDEETVSSPSAIPGEQVYNIPIGVQLVPEKKTPLVLPRGQEVEEGRSSDGSTATANRAGNVVARLMGLDQLPHQAAPWSTPAGGYSHEFESPPPFRTHQQRKAQQHHREASRRETSAMTPSPRRPLQPRNCNILAVQDDVGHGTRSLPNTPRTSLARRSWDTDPRLSLQLNYKENASTAAVAVRDLRCSCDSPGECYSSVASLSPSFPTRKALRQQLEENRSPGRYAQDIMKQVKENVTRRQLAGRDCDVDAVVRTRGGATKVPEKKPTTGEEPRQPLGRSPTAPSCSPRPRFPDSPKNKPVTIVLAAEDTHVLSSSPKFLHPPPPPPPPPTPRPFSPTLPAIDREVLVKLEIKPVSTAASSKGKRADNSERFIERIRKPPVAAALEEPFVPSSPSAHPRKKCLPSIAAAFVPRIRKEPPTSPPPPPSPQPQVQLPAQPALRQLSDQLLKCDDGDRCCRERSNSTASAGPDEEYRYVWCMLERAGVHSRTPLPFATARWYSPSHPMDPLLFQQLERSFHHTSSSGPLRHRCNRKLLFHLVDEVLADLLWPVLHAAAWPRSSAADGEALAQSLWERVRGFPSADCRVIEDIDALVEGDLPAANVRRLLHHPAVSDEAGAVASALEAAIMESLVGETAAALLTPQGAQQPCWAPRAARGRTEERRVTVA